MRLTIQPEVIETFKPIIGVIWAKGLDNAKHVPEIDDLFAEVAEATKSAFASYESTTQHPQLKAWREAYKKFGSDPHQYRCSAEALTRRVLKGDLPPRINTLVDLYNYISLKYTLPVGGEDTAYIMGDVQLAFADGTEHFVRLGGTEEEPPEKGEVVYKDDAGVICRRWNWREADRTKLTEETRGAIIVIDALPPADTDTVLQAAEELAALIKRFCGGTSRTEVRTS